MAKAEFLRSEFSREITAAEAYLFKAPASLQDLEPLPADIPYYSRLDWKSEELPKDKKDKEAVPIKFPLEYVRLVNSRGIICNSQTQCLLVMKSMQRDIRAYKFLDDVYCNFYIGFDGAVYEGRGWFEEALRIPKYSYMTGKTVDIAFFMDRKSIWKKLRAKEAAEEGVKKFIKYGMDTGLIMRDAKIVSHRS